MPLTTQALDLYLSRGMQVMGISLNLMRLPERHNLFGNQVYRGLCELELKLKGRDPLVNFSWLLDFAIAHPRLEKIIFHIDMINQFLHNACVPLISLFLDEVRRRELAGTMNVVRYAISRTRVGLGLAARDSFGEWHVSGMFLRILQWSPESGRMLHLAHSLFPRISVLSIMSKVVVVSLYNLLASLRVTENTCVGW